jgi:hypothetical protein
MPKSPLHFHLQHLGQDKKVIYFFMSRVPSPYHPRYRFQTQGYDFDWLVGQVASLLNLDHSVVTRHGRYPDTVEARSVLCYWAARELGISTLELSRKLGISQPTASQSVKRGERIVREKRLKLKG